MFWRKRTNEEEIDELHGFVEGMKRGQTLATGDSLLETLRQIHDRRETPVVGHDHKRMLAERLRREMRVRAGQAVNDTVRVPSFAPAPVRRRFLEWAVAASLVFHVGLGVLVLEHVHFGRIFGVSAAGEVSSNQSTDPVYEINWLQPAPIVTNRSDSRQHPTIGAPPSIGQAGHGHVGTTGPLANASSPVASSSSAPVGPAVAPGGNAPIVASYNQAGLEGPADRGIPDGAGSSLGGPSDPPTSEVGDVKFDRPDNGTPVADYDVAAKILYCPKPMYTTKGLEYNIKGEVKVSVVLAADGTIREVKVLRSLGYGLDEEAINVVQRIKFTPASRNGQPVTTRRTVAVKFGIL